ncbi:CidA/LrgA family protein [Erysipelothrix sp. HDW6C]|uniref:CidA/LrgA family protein n=1 Tax=Erysipelothrix sp. HDW6C TaxID=2714930 RepID=UPI00140748E8|nr:CidA/LrgA family protein [Erysipelothrix sp. HDW6C]QIK70736.1 CidA/LrgA family protein [Erysipelothrix sp. HDW6C]
MEIIFQFMIIAGFAFAGDAIALLLHLPIPGSIIGLILLFLALQFKILELKKVERVGLWLKNNLAFLFVPITVGIITYFDILKTSWLNIVIVLVVSTLFTYLVTAFVATKILAKGDN